MSRIQKTLLKSILIENGVPFYVEDSGSPYSVHIWVFFEHPTPLYIAYNWARAMIVRGSQYVFNSEIFPKQAALNPEKPYGNLVKVPFGIHQKSGRRTYFYDSFRGKPDEERQRRSESQNAYAFFDDDYMERVETIDISDWQPVNLPQNERSERRCVKRSKEKTRLSDTIDYSSEDVGLYRYASQVRPCIKALIESNIPLRHEHGHKLRIAIASELLGCGKTMEEVAEVFRSQEDFDIGITQYQIASVRGYNRPTCQRIQWHCRGLENESGFKIDNVCRTCVFSERAIESINKQTRLRTQIF